jgi:hypothetical protein
VDRDRRRAAKLLNERLKLAATFFNNLGIATFIAFALAPYASGASSSLMKAFPAGLAFMIVLHLMGQAVLSLWRSEE